MIWAAFIFDLFMLGWFLKLCGQHWPRTPEGRLQFSWVDKTIIAWNAIAIPAFIYMVVTGAYG